MSALPAAIRNPVAFAAESVEPVYESIYEPLRQTTTQIQARHIVKSLVDPYSHSGAAQWLENLDAVRRKHNAFTVPEVSESIAAPLVKRTETKPALTSVPRQVASQLLAEWHGQVVAILEGSFLAQLRGAYGQGVAGKEDEAEIPLDDVREADHELLEPGAFFRLCISYEINEHGSKRRFTEVVFRRLPAYRREELEAARERGREISRGLRLE